MAIVTEAMKSIDIKPVIVGGQAVEFYTSGGYSTMDIDFICGAYLDEINSVLNPLGFKKEGKYWFIENSPIVIEVPSGSLAGSWDKVTEVEIEDVSAYIIGIEDIIVDRLNRYKFWKEYDDKEWIIGMMLINYDDIDWDYLHKRAREEFTEEELIRFREIVEDKYTNK